MVEVVNLRQRRKQRVREDSKRAAAENRAKFGRKKGARQSAEAESHRAGRDLDGHKLDE
jgi:hypothetical protein